MKKFVGCLMYLILCLLIMTLPSVNISSLSDSTRTSKFLVFSCVCILLNILFVFDWITNKKDRIIKITISDILLFVFLIFVITLRSVKPNDYAFSLRYYELFGLSVIYIIIKNTAHKPLFFFVSIVMAGIIQAIYGSSQLYGFIPSNHQLFSLTGGFFNPGPYAGYLISVLPVAAGLYLNRSSLTAQSNLYFVKLSSKQKSLLNDIFYKVVPISGVITIISVIPATQSRAAWIAVLISSVFLLQQHLLVLKKIYLQVWRKGILAAIVVASILSLFFAIYLFKPKSANGRVLIWKVTSKMFFDHPVMGCGFDGFKSHYMNYQKGYFQNSLDDEASFLADDVFYAFNEPLQFLSENGLIGSALMLVALILIIKDKSEKNVPVVQIAKAGIISVFCFSLFSYPSSILPIKLNNIIFLSLLSSFCNPIITLKLKGKRFPIFDYFLIGTFIVIIGIAINGYRNLKNLYNGFKEFNNGTICYQSSDYDHAIYHYSISYKTLYNDGPFLLQYGKALFFLKESSKALFILNRAQLYNNNSLVQIALGDSYKSIKKYKASEQAYLSACDMTPSRFYPKYLLAKLYDESHQTKKAIEVAKEILSKKVKVSSPAIFEIRSEMRKIIETN